MYIYIINVVLNKILLTNRIFTGGNYTKTKKQFNNEKIQMHDMRLPL